MSYPERWQGDLDPLWGDIVPLVEELVPTENDGTAMPPGGNELINLDINYNNGKPLFSELRSMR